MKLLSRIFCHTGLACPSMTTSSSNPGLVRHVLTSPSHDDACYGSDAKVPDTPKSVTRKLRHLPLNYPLRTKWQYSNYMYTVSAYLVESFTGQWLGSFLRERIWEPLKMKDTYYGNEDLRSRTGMSGLAKGYGWDDEAQDFFKIPWPFQPEGSGAGEMISSALDYAEFLRCMIHKTLPISQDGHAELVKPRMLTGEEMRPFVSPGTYALGWERYDYHGEAVVGHDGSVDGFCSKMVYLPRLKWGLVVFGNSQDAYPTEERMCWTLIDELLGVPVEKRFGWDKDEEDSDGEEKPKSKEELYPSLPDVSILLTMPLSAYVGAYHHPGFGTFEVEVKDGKLQVNGTDRTWKIMLYLEHVSGEYFIAKLFSVNTRDKDTFRAQFRIGTDGVVGEFGVEIVNNMENEKIWFRRG